MLQTVEQILENFIDLLARDYSRLSWYKWYHRGQSDRQKEFVSREKGGEAYFRNCETITEFPEGVFGITITLLFQESYHTNFEDLDPYEKNHFFRIKVVDFYAETGRKLIRPHAVGKNNTLYEPVKALYEKIWHIAKLNEKSTCEQDSFRTIYKVFENRLKERSEAI